MAEVSEEENKGAICHVNVVVALNGFLFVDDGFASFAFHEGFGLEELRGQMALVAENLAEAVGRVKTNDSAQN